MLVGFCELSIFYIDNYILYDKESFYFFLSNMYNLYVLFLSYYNG